jgi:S1-C subfamily serine protease
MSPPPRILAAALLLLTMPPAPGWTAAEKSDTDEQRLYERLLKSTVWVLAFKGDLARAEGFAAQAGTGWVVDVKHRLIITNYHIVRGMDAAVVSFPAFRDGKLVLDRNAYLGQVRRDGIVGKVVATDEKRDLAVIELRALPRGALVLPFAAQDPRPRQTVYSLGNPGSDKMWCFFSQKVANVARRRFLSTSMAANESDHVVDARVIRAELPADAKDRGPGESGGPLVNARGELVGVTQSATLTGPSPHIVFIAVSEVRAMLKGKNLLPTPGGPGVAGSRPKAAPASGSAPPPGAASDADAAVQLKLARQLADAGRLGAARDRLEGLIRKYPKTAAAGEARKLLEQMRD